MQGNQVSYQYPQTPRIPRLGRGAVFLLVTLAGVCAAGTFLTAHHTPVNWLATLAALGFLLGINTVTYEYPITGLGAPSADQMAPHQHLSSIITGDGAATAFTVVHNWGLTAQENLNAFPWVEYENLLISGYNAAPLITSKNPNNVVFSCTAFTGAGLRVRMQRPWTPLR